MRARGPLLLVVAAAIGIAAFLKRPVRHPEMPGDWSPAEHQRTRR